MVNIMAAQKYQRPISPDLHAWGILFFAIIGMVLILVLGITLVNLYVASNGYNDLAAVFIALIVIGVLAMLALAFFAQRISVYYYRKRDPS